MAEPNVNKQTNPNSIGQNRQCLTVISVCVFYKTIKCFPIKVLAIHFHQNTSVYRFVYLHLSYLVSAIRLCGDNILSLSRTLVNYVITKCLTSQINYERDNQNGTNFLYRFFIFLIFCNRLYLYRAISCCICKILW